MRRKKLGPAIMSARKAKRMTQTDLAEKCGLARSEISELETGKQKRLANVDAGIRMAKALGLSPFWMLKLGRPNEWKAWVKAIREEATL